MNSITEELYPLPLFVLPSLWSSPPPITVLNVIWVLSLPLGIHANTPTPPPPKLMDSCRWEHHDEAWESLTARWGERVKGGGEMGWEMQRALRWLVVRLGCSCIRKLCNHRWSLEQNTWFFLGFSLYFIAWNRLMPKMSIMYWNS